MFVSIILVCMASFACGDAANILITYPTISQSHILPLQALAFKLLEKGHSVTFMTSYPSGKKINNYREITVPFDESEKDFMKDIAKNPTQGGTHKMLPKLLDVVSSVGNRTLQMEETQQLMKTAKFDVVIVGWFMTTDVMIGMGAHFNCPTILFSPAGAMGTLYDAVGNPKGVNGFPHVLLADKRMDFMGRLKTFAVSVVEVVLVQYFKYRSRQVYDYNFPADRYRSYDDSLKNVSLVLLNNHFSSSSPRPLLPNFVEVGGLQVNDKPSELPENMKKVLDDAKDGAILFSLGSNAKSTYLPAATIKILLNVFGKLKQRVIMKWESDTLEGKPANVFISKWLPQNDVLAHPNIKAFISHCGMGGVAEAKFHGVPIVALPMFADQRGNAGGAVKEGWAIELDFETLTEKDLEAAVVEIIKNKKYSQIAQQQSKLISDRPLSAQETAAYWVEYVIRHRGAPHMHYPGADQNFLQKNSLDVIGFILFVLYVIIKALKFAVKKMCKLCCGNDMKQKIN